MKTAFNIPPVTDSNAPLHLLVEAGHYGISFLWFTKEQFAVKGLEAYNFSPADAITDMRQIVIHAEKHSRPSSVTICYDFSESILVPSKYHNPALRDDLLALNYGKDATSATKTDFITSADIFNLYRVPKNVETALNNIFTSAIFFHSSSLQLELLHDIAKDTSLYCTVFHNTLKAVLYKNSELQIVQQFNYNTPSDIAYHVLNLCIQYNISRKDVKLKLNGMIDVHSILYKELYAYFENIEFENIPPYISIVDEMKILPAHFFSHLISLATCV